MKKNGGSPNKMNMTMKPMKHKMLSEEKEYNDMEDLDKMFTYDEAMTVATHRVTKQKFAMEVIAGVKYEVR